MVSALVVACISWFEFEVHSTYTIVKQSFLLRKQVHKDPTSVNFCKSCDKKDGNPSFFIFNYCWSILQRNKQSSLQLYIDFWKLR